MEEEGRGELDEGREGEIELELRKKQEPQSHPLLGRDISYVSIQPHPLFKRDPQHHKQ